MFGDADHGWGLALLVAAVPVVLITAVVAVIAVLTLTARRRSTRDHCLQVLQALTGYLRVLRGRR